jgi:hypothetical protein
LCAVGGVLATYSQANGLFVLPLAGLACLALGHRRRAVFFLLVAAAIWALYFTGYSRPHNHPSVLKALEDPVRTFQLFLIIIGGVVPSLQLSQLYGAAILALLGWVTWRGLWRAHPTVFLWIAFVLISAGTVAAARVGFGLFYGGRYSVNAALLMAMLAFSIFAVTKPWPRGLDVGFLAAAAVVWSAITIVALGDMRGRNVRGRLLAQVAPAGADLGLPGFVGVLHPGKEHAIRILRATMQHGWYRPRLYPVGKSSVALARTRPSSAGGIGVMDEVVVEGRNVTLRGWTHLGASVPSRKFTLYPGAGIAAAEVDRLYVREDVAMALQKPEWILSGFRIAAEYPSEIEAREAAASLCLFVEAPGHEATQIVRSGIACD